MSPHRLSSIGWQFRIACESGATSFLNVGVGAGVLEYLLEKSGKRVLSVDLDFALSPSVVACLPYLPFKSTAIDAVTAFQLLEHMPFELLIPCLGELARVAREFIIISLPDQTPLPERKIDRLRRLLNPKTRRSKVKDRQVISQHFWEIGVDDVSAGNVVELACQVHLELVKHFRNHLYPYHHFFVFRKSSE